MLTNETITTEHTSALAAYIYLVTGEQMPAPVLDENRRIDVAADDAVIEAWSNGVDTFVAPDPVDLERFILETSNLLDNLQTLELNAEEDASQQYMTLFYDAAKATFDGDKSRIRTYFMWLYIVLFRASEGPRWGEFVNVIGVSEFVTLATTRFNEVYN